MTRAQILIVEDEGIVALDLKNRLARLGYVVPAVAASGEEAIQKAAETRPDLVLMGIRLKGNLDGIQTAQQIQAQLGVPVIYVTALADDDTMQRAQATGHYGYIPKPFEDEELHTTIETALSRHRAKL